MGKLKPQSNGPLHSNTVIGTLAVDEWAVTFGTARRDQIQIPNHPNVTAHPSTANARTSYHSLWHYNCFCAVKPGTHWQQS